MQNFVVLADGKDELSEVVKAGGETDRMDAFFQAGDPSGTGESVRIGWKPVWKGFL